MQGISGQEWNLGVDLFPCDTIVSGCTSWQPWQSVLQTGAVEPVPISRLFMV